MSRIPVPSLDAVPAESKPLLDAVQKQLGIVPNSFRVLGLSPVVLQSFLGQNAALGKTLDLKTRERIAIAVAQVNGCDYCLSAHSYLAANMAKLDAAEIAHNRQGGSGDPKANAAVAFAVAITENRGHVSDGDFAAVRDAGFSDRQIVEIVAIVAENVFTNLLNTVTGIEIDFPVVTAKAA